MEVVLWKKLIKTKVQGGVELALTWNIQNKDLVLSATEVNKGPGHYLRTDGSNSSVFAQQNIHECSCVSCLSSTASTNSYPDELQ